MDDWVAAKIIIQNSLLAKIARLDRGLHDGDGDVADQTIRNQSGSRCLCSQIWIHFAGYHYGNGSHHETFGSDSRNYVLHDHAPYLIQPNVPNLLARLSKLLRKQPLQ
jgi:hypothetical protein